MRSLIAVLCYASIAAFGGPAYSVQVIQAPAGFNALFTASGINNSGQTVGTGVNGSGFQQLFIGSPSLSVAIPLVGSDTVWGEGINSAGQIAGTSWQTGLLGQIFMGAFIATTSGLTGINPPAGWSAVYSEAINDSGQITGGAEMLIDFGLGTSAVQAFIGNGSGSTVLPLPAGWTNSVGLGLNNPGQVTGYVYNVNSAVTLAFIGTASSSQALPLPPGWSSATGFAINDSAQVAGFGSNAASNQQAFIGTVSSSAVIPLPAGASSATVAGQSINNSGVVVGASNAGGWIWDSARGVRLLNALVPSGWNISNGISISNNGLILAQGSLNGGAPQYVELAPATPLATPAPATWMLVALGLGLLPVVRRFTRRNG